MRRKFMRSLILTIAIISGIAAICYSKALAPKIDINKVPASPVTEQSSPKTLKDFAITGLLPPFIEQVRN
jgi:hypothetical protein